MTTLFPPVPLDASKWPCGCAYEKVGDSATYDRIYVCLEHQSSLEIARPEWREIVFLRVAA